MKEFTNFAREVTRKRNERLFLSRLFPAHAKQQKRTRYLGDWRKRHEQLVVMTGLTKGLGGVGMEVGGMDMEEVKEVYEVVKRVDVSDVSVGMCFVSQESLGGAEKDLNHRGNGELGHS
jgi:hypothetical protein